MGIEIKGLDRLYRKLDKAASQKVLEAPMQRGLFRMQRRMQEEPPPLSPIQGPQSRPVLFTTRGGRAVSFAARARKPYRRTGRYRKGWTTKITKAGNGLQGKVGNNVAYGPWVGSAQFQAKIHQGRWNTDDKIVRQEQPGILADFQAEVDKALAE